MNRISVAIALQRLRNAGLEKMDGVGSGVGGIPFEIWIWPNGVPEMVPYADASCQECVAEAVDGILQGTPY